MKKVKDPNRLRLKDYLGATGMSAADGITSALMTSWFMVYLTDYAGIGEFAAILGGVVLVLARLFDAVNDPIEGMIMDRAKVGKLGKYKPFVLLSIVLVTLGVIALFFIPEGVAKSPVLVTIWVVVFYLMYDIGYSFFGVNLVYRTMTLDPGERGKLMIGPRTLGIFMGMISSSLISTATNMNANIGNMHTSIGITVVMFVGGFGLVALLGTSMVKERYHSPRDENEPEVKLIDFVLLVKENKAVRMNLLAMLFGGFIWNFLFATLLYYIKWGLCTDLTTGVVNQELYGTMSLVASLLMLFPLIIGTLVATPLMKLFQSALRLKKFLALVQAVSCGMMYVLHITGILNTNPMLFLVCAGITAFAIGVEYIPNEVINIECMDYEVYATGKDRSALINAFAKFMGKAQGALATAVIGFLLNAIGYVVDSETDAFIGDLANIPTMIDGFVVICGLLPCIMGIIAYLFLRKYPITDEIRTDMKAKLAKKD